MDTQTRKCANCKFFEGGTRLGTCHLYRELSLADNERFHLLEDVGPTMVCDAFEGDEEPGESEEPSGHKFSSTQFVLPEDLAAKVREFAASIPDEDLAEDGREDNPHITVRYGLHTQDADEVEEAIAGHEPVTVVLGSTSLFAANDADPQRGGAQHDVLKIDVHGDMLHELNQTLGTLEHTDTHPTYQPHITIAYLKPGRGAKYAGDDRFAGTELTFEDLVFSPKDGEPEVLSLVEAEEEPFYLIAKRYTDEWNEIESSGGTVPFAQTQKADEQLQGTGWGVDWDGEEWDVVQYPVEYGAERSPRGGVTINGKFYRGGQWIPSGVARTKEAKQKIAEAKAKNAAKKEPKGKKEAAEGKRDDGLEPVFSKGHELHDRIFYDPKEGKYYDMGSDLYLSLEEAAAFGLGPKGEKVAEKKAEGKPESHWGSKEQPYWRPGKNPTVDNVITRTNPETGEQEVLLIQRAEKNAHGDPVAEGGKWALPGGFHDTDAKKGEPWKPGKETAEEAALRELKEETGLDADQLKGAMKPVGEYDERGRDPRDNEEAWSASSAFKVHLTPEQAKAMEDVEGKDDAQNAKWVPLHQLGAYDLAFDHKKILKDAGVEEPSSEYGHQNAGLEGPARHEKKPPVKKAVDLDVFANNLKETYKLPAAHRDVLSKDMKAAAEKVLAGTVSPEDAGKQVAATIPGLKNDRDREWFGVQVASALRTHQNAKQRRESLLNQIEDLRHPPAGVGPKDRAFRIQMAEELDQELKEMGEWGTGSSPDVFAGGSNQAVKEDVASQIRAVSSGTLAKVFGTDKYDEIDKKTAELLDFVNKPENAGKFGTWQDAVEAFKNRPAEKRDWLGSTGEKRENVLAAMRSIDERAQAAMEQARKLQPPHGTIGVGGADFDEVLKGESLSAFIRHLNQGKTPDEALAEAKADARAMIEHWNKNTSRGRMKVANQHELDRWEWAADSGLEDAYRSITRATEEAAKPAAGGKKPNLYGTGMDILRNAIDMGPPKTALEQRQDELRDHNLKQLRGGYATENQRRQAETLRARGTRTPEQDEFVSLVDNVLRKEQAEKDLEAIPHLDSFNASRFRHRITIAKGDQARIDRVMKEAREVSEKNRLKEEHAKKPVEQRRAEEEAAATAEMEKAKFSPKVESIKPRGMNAKSLVKAMKDKNLRRAPSMIAAAKELGIFTDGRMLMVLPEAEQKAFKDEPFDKDIDYSWHATRFKPAIEGVMESKHERQAATIAGARDREIDHGKKKTVEPQYLLKSPTGKQAAINANYVETIRKRYPNAKPYLGAKNEEGPVVFKDGDKVVGVVMPLSRPVGTKYQLREE